MIALYGTDPAQAALTWQGVESVANGLDNANGEILGGLWTLMVSLVALRAGELLRSLNILDLLVGVVGILSLIPAMTGAMIGVYGLGHICWYVWLKNSLHLKKASSKPPSTLIIWPVVLLNLPVISK